MSKRKWIVISAVIVLLLLILGIYSYIHLQQSSYNRYRYQLLELPEKFTVTAHTGCMDTKENSIEAIEAGAQNGAQIVEFDLNFNENNEPILSHNDPKGGEVTLEEAFKKVAEYDGIQVNVDLKSCAALEKIKDTAEQCGVLDRIFFTGVGDNFLEAVQEAKLGIPYYLNVNVDAKQNTDTQYLNSLVQKVKDSGAIGINFNKDNASADLVKIFHENGLLVSIWTVDKDRDMQKILAFAPDNITTRRPKELNEVIAVRKQEALTAEDVVE